MNEEVFRHHPKNRKWDESSMKEAEEMLRVDPNRKLVRQHFAEKTGKTLIMRDIHNIAWNLKCQGSKSASSSPVEDLCKWVVEKYPSMKLEVVLEDGTVVGLFFQDPQMMSAFDRFPEVVLMDATYKTNNQDMALYMMLCIDGNGESQVAASFLIQKEDETSIQKMIKLFKAANPKWSNIKVVMTDKDMTERAIIKSEIPQVAL